MIQKCHNTFKFLPLILIGIEQGHNDVQDRCIKVALMLLEVLLDVHVFGAGFGHDVIVHACAHLTVVALVDRQRLVDEGWIDDLPLPVDDVEAFPEQAPG